MIDAWLVAAMVSCILVAALLAGAEVSLLRVRKTQVAAAADGGDQGSERLLALLDDLPVVLNVVLLLVLLAQVGTATISAFLAARWFGGIGIPVMSIVVTGALFIYGEALPKTRAAREPQRVATRVSLPLQWAVRLLRPPVAILVRIVDFQSGPDSHFDAVTEAELRLLARESAAVGEIEQGDVDLLERSFRFGDLEIRHVMVARSKMCYVRVDERADVALGRALAFGHRRLPVVRQGVDDVVGVVRLRDLAAASDDGPVGSSMSNPLFCAPTESLAAVLTAMRTNEQWLAIVREDGGERRTIGLVTIEDIVAELVGEIADDR